jgi:drug/metabolite transporter (DMT)-like permease
MVLSALSFSLMSLTVKMAGQRLPVMELVFARALAVSALAGADLARRRVALWDRQAPLLLARGLVGFVALSLFYYSVVHLPLAEATVLHFTNPVFTAVIAALFLAEALRPREFALALASLAGVAVMVRPAGLFGAGPPLPPLAVASSLAASLLAAVAYVIVRHMRRLDAMLIVFHFAAISVVGAAPLMLPSFVMPQGGEWAVLAGVGVSTFFGQLFLTLGLQRERAGRATTAGYLQIVFATLWGALVFGQVPGPVTLLGAAIIIGCTLLLARLREAPPPEEG